MVNPELGEIALRVGDQVYTLTLKTMGLSRFQSYFSRPKAIAKLDDLWAAVKEGSVEHITVLVWAALQKHHPGITLEGTADLIDAVGGIVGLNDQLMGLSASSTPDPADLKALGVDDARPRKAQRRRRSGGITSTVMHAGSD